MKGMAYRHEEKDEVIKGYRVDGETICPACNEEELEEITKGDVLTENDLEEEPFSCARCKQQL